MINTQAVETMTQMLSLITKYAKRAYPEVETEASYVNRRRARDLAFILARFAEHSAKSDMYSSHADDPSRTDAEREQCDGVAHHQDNEFMRQLYEFRKCAEQFENEPVTGKLRTDDDIVRELECLLTDAKMLQTLQADLGDGATTKATKEELKRREASRVVIAENFEKVNLQLEAVKKLALSRGMVVSMNQRRTVIKRVAPAPAQSTKQPSSATKAKNAAILKLLAKTTAQQAKPKTTLATKSA